MHTCALINAYVWLTRVHLFFWVCLTVRCNGCSFKLRQHSWWSINRIVWRGIAPLNGGFSRKSHPPILWEDPLWIIWRHRCICPGRHAGRCMLRPFCDRWPNQETLTAHIFTSLVVKECIHVPTSSSALERLVSSHWPQLVAAQHLNTCLGSRVTDDYILVFVFQAAYWIMLRILNCILDYAQDFHSLHNMQ